MKKIFYILYFCFYTSLTLFAQEIKKGVAYDYARIIVDTLASKSMHGRGYVNGGDKIAANYIKSEFQKLGLKSFSDNYFQSLSFPINTFPGKMLVKIDRKELVPGKDYLVDPYSPSCKGTYRLKYFISEKDTSVQIFAPEKRNPPMIYLEKKKLTHELGQKADNTLTLRLLKSSLPFNASEIEFDIQNRFVRSHQTQNVIAYVEGSAYPDSFIVFSAHYDHLGHMGKDVYFPGANDNASGCAMLLNLAKYYSLPENKPKCSIAFIAFCGEEVGLLGSKYYTEHPLFPLANIKFLLNMDIFGTGEEGVTAVNGVVFKNEFDLLKSINDKHHFIKDVKPRGKAANSDHYYFSEKGVKAFFIYTMGGIKAYHDIYDKPETLPLNEFENLFELIIAFGDYLQRN